MRELFTNQSLEMVHDSRLIEPLEDLVQETGDDEALGDRNGNATRAEIDA